VILAAGVGAVVITNHHKNSNGPQHREPAYGSQVTLPFTGLNYPDFVAVDSAGNLYVIDRDNNRVLKLAAGSTSQQVLPSTGLDFPMGVAVDAAGNLYVADGLNNRVVKLPAA
jgi:serine/threonine-protein kinase